MHDDWQRPHGSSVSPPPKQHALATGFVQSIALRQIWIGHPATPHEIGCAVPCSQHGLPPQSSIPSHVASIPVHSAERAVQRASPAMRSRQHFCSDAHTMVPQTTADDAASPHLPARQV